MSSSTFSPMLRDFRVKASGKGCPEASMSIETGFFFDEHGSVDIAAIFASSFGKAFDVSTLSSL
jgi:hypothetical protein